MIEQFFQRDEFFIDQKVNVFKLANQYKVYGNQGEEIGMVMQKMNSGQKVMKLLLNSAMLPFHLEIQDQNGTVLSTISRGWTLWMSKMAITSSSGEVIGYIEQRFKLMKPEFKILDASKNLVGMIKGDWTAWNFSIQDANEQEIGVVNKKWAGAMLEVFTKADKYHVTINPSIAEDTTKVLILSAAISIDMVLKEVQN